MPIRPAARSPRSIHPWLRARYTPIAWSSTARPTVMLRQPLIRAMKRAATRTSPPTCKSLLLNTSVRDWIFAFPIRELRSEYPEAFGVDVVVQDSFDLRPATPGGSISSTILAITTLAYSSRRVYEWRSSGRKPKDEKVLSLPPLRKPDKRVKSVERLNSRITVVSESSVQLPKSYVSGN